MSDAKTSLVLDAWAVMALLTNEPEQGAVQSVLAQACENQDRVMMSVVNAAEIWYNIARRFSLAEAETTHAELTDLGIEFIPADWELSRLAADFKARHRMSLADCYAAALARREGASLITGDREFESVEQEIEVTWI